MLKDTTRAKLEQIFKDKGGVNKGCKYIEKRLNYEWTWKYIYHVFRDTVKASPILICKLNALQYPPLPRYRLKTEAETKEQFESWKTITNKRRAELFNQEVKGERYV